MKTSQQIRQEFIQFFESKGHHFVRSAPVVPLDDPTLLFSNAGMNQFKDIFLGKGSRAYTRATNSQKCIRASGKHNDLEDVGRDNYHHTFFEMLGNWSFGDYFKEDAIQWAWELCVDQWKLPADKLWATVFEGSPNEGLGADEEAETIWRTKTPINPDQVIRCSKKDNFWEMGDWGPCGPCSELHIDLGEGTCPLSHEHTCEVNQDGCWRFVELWNLVFIQFNRLPSGELESLPDKHVDTGMGLERVCRVLQSVDSNYATDLFVPILKKIEQVTGVTYQDGEVGVAFHVIADHLRSLAFAIADGALPSNEGRGYVLRRMLRRATRFGRVLNMDRPFIHELVPTLVDVMGDAFPEIQAQQKHVCGVIEAEETSFGQTLDRGLEIFHQMVSDSTVQQSQTLSGDAAFKLYDTYGFPVDLTRLMCEEKGLQVDEDGFETLMNAQKQKARDAAKFQAAEETWTVFDETLSSNFIGYQTFESDASVLRYSQTASNQWMIILDQTPFYAESGGQVGDQGTLTQGTNTWKVLDVRKEAGWNVHVCEGSAEPQNAKMHACIDVARRQQITANHTATHLMHKALQEVIGDHAKQAGSIVHPDYLRFDFTHFERLTDEQLQTIEDKVNREIRNNTSLQIYETGYDDAIASGITALFGEKYEDQVRVVQVGGYSSELCGGCHVNATGEIGSFKISSESSIATGVRRIVAITGAKADQQAQQDAKLVAELKVLLNTTPEQVQASVEQLVQDKRALEKELSALKKEAALQDASKLTEQAQQVAGVSVLSQMMDVDSMDAFKSLGDSLRQQLQPGIVVLGTCISGKASILCAVSEDMVKAGVKAGELINLVAALADGRGGGKPHMAQAGAKSPEKLPDAIQQAPEIIQSYLSDKNIAL